MNSSQRILDYINFKGISKREFYKNTGLSNGYLDKTDNLSANKLAKVLVVYPDLNLYYVVAGIGTITNSKMVKMIKNHQPALHLVGNINESKKAIISETAPNIEQVCA
jgi:hypothetical protein